MENPQLDGYYGPHELHVTVAPDSDQTVFRSICDDLGVKAHIIYNETPAGVTTVDLLTGSELEGGSGSAFVELGKIATGLRSVGLEVVREKIETTPWHPAAPKMSLDQMRPGTYFECHFTLPDLPAMHGYRPLEWGGVPFLISTTDSKRQRNLLFATMRHYISTAGAFCESVDRIHGALSAQLGEVKKPTVEFALYDSNPHHDKEWVNAYR
ncbi:hypothetical protein KA047_02945 [Candidatus Saccharibacteria bacterium]|nr:hypothetical protein [Candidatus Saccharibacteria bacterium]